MGTTIRTGWVRMKKQQQKKRKRKRSFYEKSTPEMVIRFTLRPVGVYHFYCRYTLPRGLRRETRRVVLVRTKDLTKFTPEHYRLKKIHRWIIVILRRPERINS